MAWRKSTTLVCVLLLVAFGLQLVGVVSVPVTTTVRFADKGDYIYGLLGYCEKKTKKCISASVGYALKDHNGWNVAQSAREKLVKILVSHIVACGCNFIMLLLVILAHWRSSRYYTGLLVLIVPTLLVSVLAFLCEILLFVPHLSWPGWLSLAAAVLDIVSFVALLFIRLRFRRPCDKESLGIVMDNGSSFVIGSDDKLKQGTFDVASVNSSNSSVVNERHTFTPMTATNIYTRRAATQPPQPPYPPRSELRPLPPMQQLQQQQAAQLRPILKSHPTSSIYSDHQENAEPAPSPKVPPAGAYLAGVNKVKDFGPHVVEIPPLKSEMRTKKAPQHFVKAVESPLRPQSQQAVSAYADEPFQVPPAGTYADSHRHERELRGQEQREREERERYLQEQRIEEERQRIAAEKRELEAKQQLLRETRKERQLLEQRRQYEAQQHHMQQMHQNYGYYGPPRQQPYRDMCDPRSRRNQGPPSLMQPPRAPPQARAPINRPHAHRPHNAGPWGGMPHQYDPARPMNNRGPMPQQQHRQYPSHRPRFSPQEIRAAAPGAIDMVASHPEFASSKMAGPPRRTR